MQAVEEIKTAVSTADVDEVAAQASEKLMRAGEEIKAEAIAVGAMMPRMVKTNKWLDTLLNRKHEGVIQEAVGTDLPQVLMKAAERVRAAAFTLDVDVVSHVTQELTSSAEEIKIVAGGGCIGGGKVVRGMPFPLQLRHAQYSGGDHGCRGSDQGLRIIRTPGTTFESRTSVYTGLFFPSFHSCPSHRTLIPPAPPLLSRPSFCFFSQLGSPSQSKVLKFTPYFAVNPYEPPKLHLLSL